MLYVFRHYLTMFLKAGCVLLDILTVEANRPVLFYLACCPRASLRSPLKCSSRSLDLLPPPAPEPCRWGGKAWGRAVLGSQHALSDLWPWTVITRLLALPPPPPGGATGRTWSLPGFPSLFCRRLLLLYAPALDFLQLRECFIPSLFSLELP